MRNLKIILLKRLMVPEMVNALNIDRGGGGLIYSTDMPITIICLSEVASFSIKAGLLPVCFVLGEWNWGDGGLSGFRD